jgi:hypothetical protein
MTFDIYKFIPIYVDSIDNQVRNKKFPDKIEYLTKVRKIKDADLPKVKSSFFEAIRLCYKAKRVRFFNNSFLFCGIVLIALTFILDDSKISLTIKGFTVNQLLKSGGTICLLFAIFISYAFDGIRNTTFNLFGEIDIYIPKPRTSTKSTSNGKTTK